MKCKNCNHTFTTHDNFCANCGGRIMKERITLRYLLNIFFEAIGWDNKYFLTVRTIVTRPQKLLGEYLDGVRKRYVNPITYFAIGVTISLVFLNLFHDEYMNITTGSYLNDVPVDQLSEIPQDISQIQEGECKFFSV